MFEIVKKGVYMGLGLASLTKDRSSSLPPMCLGRPN